MAGAVGSGIATGVTIGLIGLTPVGWAVAAVRKITISVFSESILL